MVISTHLPPPVIIDSTAVRHAVTHILCCSWAMCFSAAASSEKVQGSMNLASNPAPVEVLGHTAELDDQVGREVFRLDLAAFLPPEPQEGGFVVPHDDPGVGA